MVKRILNKYFIGYKDAKKIRPLWIFLPKKSVYRRDIDKTKCMSFLIREEYNEIWKKAISLNIRNFWFPSFASSLLKYKFFF